MRTIQPLGSIRGGQIVIASAPAGAVASNTGNNHLVLRDAAKGTSLAISVDSDVQGALQVRDGQVVFTLAKARAGSAFRIAIASGDALPPLAGKAADLRKLTQGGPAHWTETVSTQGKLNTGGGDGSYVVDTITEPFPNPYRVSTFLGASTSCPTDGRRFAPSTATCGSSRASMRSSRSSPETLRLGSVSTARTQGREG